MQINAKGDKIHKEIHCNGRCASCKYEKLYLVKLADERVKWCWSHFVANIPKLIVDNEKKGGSWVKNIDNLPRKELEKLSYKEEHDG